MSMILKILCLFYVIFEIEPARILGVFPTPSISHQAVFRPLMLELVKRGHEVVVITPNPAFPKGKTPENLTEIDVHDVSYKIANEILLSRKIQTQVNYEQTKKILEMIGSIFEAQVKSDQVQHLINDKSKGFDLLIIESIVRIALSFQYLYDVPVIEFSSIGGSFGTFNGFGAPTNPIAYPAAIHSRVNNLTLWEKIVRLYTEYTIDMAVYEAEKIHNQLVKKLFGPNVPDLNVLRQNVQMIFLNVNPIWDFNRPVPPNVLYLGGIHENPSKELPKDLKKYLDASQNGVIYISFGTNVRSSLMPQEKLKIFTNVFSQLPYDILWKWDSDDIPGCPKNAKVSKWFPQSDLLKHPKIKLFITQGGLQSTDEALTAGVPLIGIPFLGDQWFNVEQYVRLNIGIKLTIETVTEESLKNAIETIIDNQSYRENVVKLGNLMRDQPQSSLERAVWWTEHVLRHGGATHLRAAAAHLHWAEYYALDVILILLTVSFTILYCFIYAIRFVLLKLSHVKVKLN